MSRFTRFKPLLESLPASVPFVGPEAIERQRGAAINARIGANENGFGPAPSVQRAIAEATGSVWAYGDPENFDLKERLADHYALIPNMFTIGEGIDGLLGLLVRMVVEENTPVVTSLGAYPTFNYHVNGFGGRLITVPYIDDREDLNGLLDAVRRENAPLIYLANPDNPMGTWHSGDDVIAFAKALPETTLLVLDEAYCEMAPAEAQIAPNALIDCPNVVRMRTFSKAYGLAGLRIGYAFGAAETIAAFDKVRNHFGVNRLGQIAACAALEDQTYLRTVLEKITASKARIESIARANGLSPISSATNFIAIDCGRDGAFAKSIVDGLLEDGVFIRMPGVAPLNRCIRVSCGPEDDMTLFEKALPNVLQRSK